MEPSRPSSSLQVVIPGNGAAVNGSADAQRLPRPLSVEEALRFSPMASAPVFALDSILCPDIGHASHSNRSLTYNSKTAGKMIDMLDNETQAGISNSAQLTAVRDGLQQLLMGESLTEFKFKLPTRIRKSQTFDFPQQEPAQLTSHHLGPFAKLILDSTNVTYRYFSPIPPSPRPKEAQWKSLPTPTPDRKPYLSEGGQPATFIKVPTPNSRPIVMIPSLPASKVDEYQPIPGPSPMKKRKLSDEDRADDLRTRDQKEMSDSALIKLQSLVEEVFEEEDQLSPDSSAEVVRPGTKYFKRADFIEDQPYVLSSDTHSWLQKALRPVRNFGRLRDLPAEYLSRLQKLCEPPILSTHSLELSLEGTPSESDIENWVRRLGDMHNCLLSIGTLLHTMSGSLSVSELCAEEVTQSIPVALNHIFDYCIIPAVECRASGKSSEIFTIISSHKQLLGNSINLMKKIFGSLASFIASVDLAEDTITAIEFLIVRLIFVENAHNDKESALGFQKYETLRRSAMDVLATVFAKYPDQRPFILDEILTSLEKLPSTKQSARQFKLADGKHVQLLSALVIQLVQTTALQKSSNSDKTARGPRSSRKAAGNDSEESSDGEDESTSGDNGGELPLDKLSRRVEPLFDNAVRSAQYITRYIVQRAMTSTKTGDQPYRNLLDLFTEDLIGVLGSPDWPGAELLLRVLASQMVGIADHDKSPANAKNMAVELLGWMGSAISELISTARHLCSTVDDTEANLAQYLRQLFDDHTNRTLHVEDLIVLSGPYRVVLEHLVERDVGRSQLSSARGYILTQWGKTVCNVYLGSEETGAAAHNDHAQDLTKSINDMFSNPRWLEFNSKFDRISTPQARLAYLLAVLNNPFCKAFDTIVKVLLGSITSEQAKVRSRSLKSVIQMLERDPGLLDRDGSILALIFRCATDSSPMVRDSALTLIARFISLKPSLEEECSRVIFACSSDPTVGVRKRCIGLMKDIYVETKRHDLRFPVIEKLLQRMVDHEESVVALARQVLEEVLFSRFYQSIDALKTSPQVKVSLGELADLIVDCVQKSGNVTPTLELFIQQLLKSTEKTGYLNFEICKAVVAAMFERVVHNSDSEDKLALPALLQSITVFARAKPTLFTPDQLETLHPYIGNLAGADDLLLFRSVVVIYRCVLPNVSSAHDTLLRDAQNDLFKSVSKLARTELNEVMACLWTINGVLKNTERLVRLAISVLKGIKQTASIQLDGTASADVLSRIRSYIRIAGCVGKHCDLEEFQGSFQKAFPDTKISSVAGLIVDFIAPFAQSKYSPEVRLMALESLGSVCQSWPAQFGREKARLALSAAFGEDAKDLQNIVLKAFLEFFSIHEGKSEKAIQPTGTGDNEPTSRLGGSLRASDNDGAAALIAQNFLNHMLHAAVSGQDSYALTAIELIASINRQGLIHPKECAGTLIALETSTNSAIAKTAYETHKMLHQQHESMFDREYMRAVQEAFHYQRDVVGDAAGALHRPFSAKLGPLFEVIKTSSSKYQKKFLTNLCFKVNFDLKKLDASNNPPEHLLLARFISQNLAFFEYGQIAELLTTISCLERIVGTTGTVLAHAIDTELFPAKMEPEALVNGSAAAAAVPADGGIVNVPADNPPVQRCDPATVKQFALAAAVLLMLWETRTYLRRLYGLSAHSKQKEGKANAKELNKAPAKVQGIGGERYWDSIAKLMESIDTIETMTDVCRHFTTLMSIDDELKVAAVDDRDSPHSAGEMDDVSGQPSTTNGTKGSKRKSGISGSNTPKKSRKVSTGNARKRRSATVDQESDLN